MRKWLIRIGLGLLVLVVILVIVVGVAAFLGARNLNQEYPDIQAEALDIPRGDAEAEARGDYLVHAVMACVSCHGSDLGGEHFIDSGFLGSLWAPNITSHEDSAVANFTDADWVRAVRHGLGPDDKPLVTMPSHWYFYASDDDLAAAIAYLVTVPPVERATEDRALTPMGLIIAGFGFPLSVEEIDDHEARPATPDEGITAEWGEYLVTIASCRECHGENLDGDVAPGAPEGPNLTTLSAEWSEQDFMNTMRQGITPSGHIIDPDDMPWEYYTRMTDDDLMAMYAYLSTLE